MTTHADPTTPPPAASTATPAATSARTTPGLAALAGLVAAGLALAVGELVAAFATGAPSPVAAVGAAVIDLAPPGTKEVVVSLFGTNDKPLLLLLVTAIVLAAGAGLGVVARSRPGLAYAGILALVGVGLLAMLRLPETELMIALLSAGLQAGVGIQALAVLLAAAPTGAPGEAPDPRSGVRARSRRGFLVRAGALGAVAVAGGAVGRTLLEGRASQVAGAAAEIPQPVD
ncbi:MAG TPA: hypothetical protein VFY23_13765, partial [Candidatus Limnocylindrales bacterium]|nr:hypothetical protein [Candidatus Limnocylindrales bacterium]